MNVKECQKLHSLFLSMPAKDFEGYLALRMLRVALQQAGKRVSFSEVLLPYSITKDPVVREARRWIVEFCLNNVAIEIDVGCSYFFFKVLRVHQEQGERLIKAALEKIDAMIPEEVHPKTSEQVAQEERKEQRKEQQTTIEMALRPQSPATQAAVLTVLEKFPDFPSNKVSLLLYAIHIYADYLKKYKDLGPDGLASALHGALRHDGTKGLDEKPLRTAFEIYRRVTLG